MGLAFGIPTVLRLARAMTAAIPPTNDPLFRPLTESVRSEKCVAVIGAGVSAGDYPLWSRLIQILEDKCDLTPADVLSTDPLDIAEAAKRKDENAYYATLGKVFARKRAPKTASRYHSLARIKFASYVTLNFDPMLVDILDLHQNVTISDFPSISVESHSKRDIFHIHGRIPPGSDPQLNEIVLTTTEFDRAYDPFDSLLHGFLQSTFQYHDVCFIGCNPSEANMRKLLAACKRLRSRVQLSGPPQANWYLLWDDSSAPPHHLLDECGVRPVIYCRGTAYKGLDNVLEYWSERQPPRIRPPGPSAFASDGDPDHG